MSLLFLLPILACAITSVLLFAELLNSFRNDQFTGIGLADPVATQARPKLRVVAKGVGR